VTCPSDVGVFVAIPRSERRSQDFVAEGVTMLVEDPRTGELVTPSELRARTGKVRQAVAGVEPDAVATPAKVKPAPRLSDRAVIR